MTLATTFRARLSALETGAPDIGSQQAPLDILFEAILATGTGVSQADRIYQDRINIAASGSTTLDLAGALAGLIQSTVVFATVKGILIRADAANVNDVIAGNVTNGFIGPFGAATHSHAIKPAGLWLAVAPKTGWTVTAGTGDLLKLANSSSGSAVDFDLVVIGTSA